MSCPSTVFVDRDGVINRKPREDDYVKAVDEFELLPGSIEALARLSKSGMRVVIVTNQQGVAKQLVAAATLEQIHQSLENDVVAAGGEIAEILTCPHIADSCDCRKPKTGLFVEAQRLHPEIDFADSVVIGDSQSDLDAAMAIGAAAIHVTSAPGDGLSPVQVESLAAAAEILLEDRDD